MSDLQTFLVVLAGQLLTVPLLVWAVHVVVGRLEQRLLARVTPPTDMRPIYDGQDRVRQAIVSFAEKVATLESSLSKQGVAPEVIAAITESAKQALRREAAETGSGSGRRRLRARLEEARLRRERRTRA